MLERYAERLPRFDGTVEALRRLGPTFRLALASSSNQSVIDAVFELADIASAFEVTVSPEEVAHGKPAPDVSVEPRAAWSSTGRVCRNRGLGKRDPLRTYRR